MSNWLVVGLGNPGVRYEKTRHNLGFLAVRALVKELDGRFQSSSRWQGDVAQVESGMDRWSFFLPMTYMNCCGPAIERYRKMCNVPIHRVLILVDDVALPFGLLRFRPEGSAGGHNGLKSIQLAFGTQEYPRLRVGVGAPVGGQDLAEYVLETFSPEEAKAMPALLTSVVEWVLARLHSHEDERQKKEEPLLSPSPNKDVRGSQ